MQKLMHNVRLKVARVTRASTNVCLFVGELSRRRKGTSFNSQSLDWFKVDCFVTVAAQIYIYVGAWKQDRLRFSLMLSILLNNDKDKRDAICIDSDFLNIFGTIGCIAKKISYNRLMNKIPLYLKIFTVIL